MVAPPLTPNAPPPRSTTGAPAATPSPPPARAAFRALSAAGRLAVPCPASSVADARPPGTPVRAGDLLTNQVPHLHPAPLAPCRGRVGGVGAAARFDGREVPVIFVDPDGPATEGAAAEGAAAEGAATAITAAEPAAGSPPAVPPPPARDVDRAEWIDRLRSAGVWADRLTSPDLLGQLHGCLRRPVDTVLCNVLEADPFLPLQAAVAAAWPEELAAGLDAVARWSGANRLWAAVAHDAPDDCADALRDAARSAEGLRVVPLRNRYPQADPTLLVYELTRRRLRPGRLPTDLGILLFDAAAAIAIGAHVLRGEPMLRVPLAVYDHARGCGHFVTAPPGMPLRDVLEQAGVSSALTSLRGGNPLRELRLSADGCVAGGAELTVYASLPEPDFNPDPCIRCAWCVEACPTRIQPAGLLDAAQERDPVLAEEYGLRSCIECGICAFVCPSHLPLLKGIRALKA